MASPLTNKTGRLVRRAPGRQLRKGTGHPCSNGPYWAPIHVAVWAQLMARGHQGVTRLHCGLRDRTRGHPQGPLRVWARAAGGPRQGKEGLMVITR